MKTPTHSAFSLVIIASLVFVLLPSCASRSITAIAPAKIRIATFNIRELTREKLDAVTGDGLHSHPQLEAAASVIQNVQPDILLINEIDFDRANNCASIFAAHYLCRAMQVSQRGLHIYAGPVNTGEPSGFDLDRNGRLGDPGDAWGFGRYRGQYGMALYSRVPIDQRSVRTFRKFRWAAMPDNLMPDGRNGKPTWYSPEEASQMRLSSKSHWDIPVQIGDLTLHVLTSHPTPPVFDGPENRNGRRNHDEIRFWQDYVSGGAYFNDDSGGKGPLMRGAAFVIVGDLNADPESNQTLSRKAIRSLLASSLVQDPDAGQLPHSGTSEFGRVDYVLPSHHWTIVDHGITSTRPGSRWANASDHDLVWIDIVLTR